MRFIENKIYDSFFLKLPEVDIIEIYGYAVENFFVYKKIFSQDIPVVLKLYSFPDEATIKFIKQNISKISQILVICQSIKDELVFSLIDEEKIRVINPSLVITRWESAKQIKPATFLQRPYRISTVYRKKRFDDLKLFIIIAREILNFNHNVSFMIVGEKDEKLREIAREYGISHKLDMLGVRTDMPEVMAMAHMYVRTDLYPIVPRSLLEALASGVVCVIPHIKGLSDFVLSDNTGIIVNARDINDYVKNIVSIMNDPIKAQTISSNAFNYAKNNFDIRICLKMEEIIYEDIILKKSSN